jgi:hypothetical protein
MFVQSQPANIIVSRTAAKDLIPKLQREAGILRSRSLP